MSHNTSKKFDKERGNVQHNFVVNVISNLAYISSQIIVTLWLTTYLIDYVGMAAFGIISLANSIVSYMTIFTTAIFSTISRFLAIEIEQKDHYNANKTFNTAFLAICAILAFLTPIVLFVTFNFPTLFEVPSDFELDSKLLFFILSLAIFITIIGSIFSVSAFIYSRFLISNAINLAGMVLRIALIIALYTFFTARAWYAGGGVFAAALISMFGNVWLWKKLTPEIHLQVRAFNYHRLKCLSMMGGWVTVNMVGAMLLARVDLVVVNIFFGASITGGYASVVQFSALMEYLVNSVSIVIRPLILKKFAQEELNGLKVLTAQTVKMLGLVLSVPVGLLCGFSKPLFTVWLGPSYDNLSTLLIVIVCHLGVNLSVRPMLDVQNAFNKIRWPGIATLLCGCLNLGMAMLIAWWGTWGCEGVALVGACIWTFKNAVFIPIYTAHIMRVPAGVLWASLVPGVVGTLFLGLSSYGIVLVSAPRNWFELGGYSIILGFIYALLVWAIGLKGDERQLLKDLTPLRQVA
jgi:membrane protein EpsK